jgi:hypothetical protein
VQIETTFDALNRPVWCIDSATGDLLYSNPCARSWCGWRQGKLPHGLSGLSSLLWIEHEGGMRPVTLDDIRSAADQPGEILDGLLKTRDGRARGLVLGVAKLEKARVHPTLVLVALAEKRSDRPEPPDVDESSLAESVAHELNNISASLFGFVELAAEQFDAGPPLPGFLAEIRLGVSRVTSLAAVLEALAEADGNSARTAISDCVGGDAPVEAGGRLRFNWECDPATVVDADAALMPRAIRTLAHLGSADSPIGSAVVFTVGRMESESRCFFCGSALARGSVKIALVADDVRLFGGKTAEARRRSRRTFRELVAAASVHVTHLAGGHVALDTVHSSISLVLAAL